MGPVCNVMARSEAIELDVVTGAHNFISVEVEAGRLRGFSEF